jgi:hypothetical protein
MFFLAKRVVYLRLIFLLLHYDGFPKKNLEISSRNFCWNIFDVLSEFFFVAFRDPFLQCILASCVLCCSKS